MPVPERTFEVEAGWVRRARVTVARHSSRTGDYTELVEMLGLDLPACELYHSQDTIEMLTRRAPTSIAMGMRGSK